MDCDVTAPIGVVELERMEMDVDQALDVAVEQLVHHGSRVDDDKSTRSKFNTKGTIRKFMTDSRGTGRKMLVGGPT